MAAVHTSLHIRPQTSQKVDPAKASVVVLGDLNGISSSCAYRLLAEGRLPAGATEPYLPGVPVTEQDLDHPFVFVDAYRGAEDVLPFTFKKVPRNGWPRYAHQTTHHRARDMGR